MQPKRAGNSGWYLRVLKWASENGLSLEVWGRLCDLVTPASIRAVAFMGPPAWRVSWPGGTACFSRVSSNSAWNRVGIGDAPADDPAAEDVENDVEIEVRSVMLMPSLICLLGAVDAINRASLQFRETGEGVVGIREQEAVGGRVADNGDCPVANAPFNPIA